jgi:hypothetical protein
MGMALDSDAKELDDEKNSKDTINNRSYLYDIFGNRYRNDHCTEKNRAVSRGSTA